MTNQPRSLCAFRARFAGVAGDEDAARAAPSTAEERLAVAIELHGFNLVLDLDRVRSSLDTDDPERVLREVNDARVATAPVPTSLAEIARRRHGPESRAG
jgi:hypothetical protein